jgi:predicted nucleic-acid-binding protein
MIGLDTNVLVRYVVQDDARQARLASKAIETHCSAEHPGFVALLVLVELVWVLDRGYGYSRAQVAAVLEGLVASAELLVEQPDLARTAIATYGSTGMDFADCLIGLVNRSRGCTTTLTFDRRAAKSGNHSLLH